MTHIKDIYKFLDKLAPFESAMNFDNSGLLIGDFNTPVKSILLSLDITTATVEEAKTTGANLIISHHPVIFAPLKSINPDSVTYKLIKNNIAAICAHTNLDMAEFGVNSCLADSIMLKDVKPLSFYNNLPTVLVGSLRDVLAPKSFAAYVKQRLGSKGLKYSVGLSDVKTVALCSGAGGNYLSDAIEQHTDAFITGEVKHHQWIMSKEAGITLIEAGHYDSENVIIKPLQKALIKAFPEVLIECCKSTENFVEFI